MIRASLYLLLASPALAACGAGNPQEDMTSASPDQANPNQGSLPDLLTAPDLLPPTVTGLPTDCAGDVVTAQAVYSGLVSSTCATNSSCHAAGAPRWTAGSANDLKAAWVNKNADGASPSMPFVTPNDLNRSYVMYKVTGQQRNASTDSTTAGSTMPLGGPALTHDQLCLLIQWIKAGAN